jgi:hypothetical protein
LALYWLCFGSRFSWFTACVCAVLGL